MITEVVHSSEIKELQTVDVKSIKSTETIFNTVYEVETTDESNNVQIVTISVEPERKPVIVQVKQPEKKETTVVKTKEETKVTKKVSKITGQKVIVTSGQEVVHQVKPYTPVIIKEVPEIARC